MAEPQTGSGSASGQIAVADLTHERERLLVTGDDRTSFLQGQCTNDVKTLSIGQSCYAAFLNAKGKMRGEGYVVCLPDAFLLDANPGLGPALGSFVVTEDVTIEDVTARLGEWLLMGEQTARLPSKAAAFRHPLGLGVISEEPMIATISTDTLEVLRLEAAVPRWGLDMDENVIPNEAGLEQRAISYDKGCYIGQETIARIKTYGHVNRRLVQLAFAGDNLPARGERILANGRDIGHVTSAAFSSRLGKALALGYVRRDFAMAGVKLELNNQTAEVLRICGE